MDSFNAVELAKKIAIQYVDVLKKEIKVTAVYLFGSSISGFFTEDSDIDIVVVSEDFSGDIINDTVRLMKLRRLVDNRIEPHPFTLKDFNIQNPFAREILKKNIKIV